MLSLLGCIVAVVLASLVVHSGWYIPDFLPILANEQLSGLQCNYVQNILVCNNTSTYFYLKKWEKNKMKKERTQIQLYLCGSEVVLCLYVSFRIYYGHRLLAQGILEPVFSVHCSKHVLVLSSAFYQPFSRAANFTVDWLKLSTLLALLCLIFQCCQLPCGS